MIVPVFGVILSEAVVPSVNTNDLVSSNWIDKSDGVFVASIELMNVDCISFVWIAEGVITVLFATFPFDCVTVIVSVVIVFVVKEFDVISPVFVIFTVLLLIFNELLDN